MKMLKKIHTVIAFVLATTFMFGSSLPVSANQGIMATQQLDYYISGRVLMEVFYTESGVIVSREYFDVFLPKAELENQYVCIEPHSTMSPTFVWLPPFGHPNNGVRVGTINSSLNPSTHTRYIHFSYEPVRGTDLVSVVARTEIMNSLLGGASLRSGQSLRITIPWNTLSWVLSAYNSRDHGGFATFTVSS